MCFNQARNLLSPHSASGQTAFGAPASPCGCPRPQSSVGWLYCIYSLHVTTNKLPLCAPSSLHTHTLSHTHPPHTRTHTNTSQTCACRTYCAVVTIATLSVQWGLYIRCLRQSCAHIRVIRVITTTGQERLIVFLFVFLLE